MRGLNMNNEVVKTLLYTSEDGAVAINVIIDSENGQSSLFQILSLFSVIHHPMQNL